MQNKVKCYRVSILNRLMTDSRTISDCKWLMNLPWSAIGLVVCRWDTLAVIITEESPPLRFRVTQIKQVPVYRSFTTLILSFSLSNRGQRRELEIWYNGERFPSRSLSHGQRSQQKKFLRRQSKELHRFRPLYSHLNRMGEWRRVNWGIMSCTLTDEGSDSLGEQYEVPSFVIVVKDLHLRKQDTPFDLRTLWKFHTKYGKRRSFYRDQRPGMWYGWVYVEIITWEFLDVNFH